MRPWCVNMKITILSIFHMCTYNFQCQQSEYYLLDDFANKQSWCSKYFSCDRTFELHVSFLFLIFDIFIPIFSWEWIHLIRCNLVIFYKQINHLIKCDLNTCSDWQQSSIPQYIIESFNHIYRYMLPTIPSVFTQNLLLELNWSTY
mgnify:CR=1 FL=1